MKKIFTIALALVVAVAFVGCNKAAKSTVNPDFVGTWAFVQETQTPMLNPETNLDSMVVITVKAENVFTDTTFSFTMSTNGVVNQHYLLNNLVWENVVNEGSNNVDFPNGVKVTGTVAEMTEGMALGFKEDGTEIVVGDPFTATFYMNNDKNVIAEAVSAMTFDKVGAEVATEPVVEAVEGEVAPEVVETATEVTVE